MPLYTRDGETASIMALAPVIPVLTVASVDDGVAQAKALVAGGLYAIEVTLRTASALAAIRAIAKSRAGRGRWRGHDRFGRADRRSGHGGGAVSGQPRRAARRSPRPRRNRRFRSCRAARRRPKRWP